MMTRWSVCAASAMLPFGALAAVPALDPTASPVSLDRAAPDFDFGISSGGVSGAGAASVDFGIPDSAPWMDPALTAQKEDALKAARQKPKHALEVRFWERLERDGVSLETWRLGLFDVLRHAHGLPQVFPKQPIGDRVLFVEYADAARDAWRRALDFFAGLDSLAARYSEFTVLEDSDERRAAFLISFAAAAAQLRFAREWEAYAARDPKLRAIFNEPVPPLGFPRGSWDRIVEARLSSDGLRAAAYAGSHYRAIGESAALARALGSRRRAGARARREDLAAFPKAAKRRYPARRAGKAVEAGVFGGVFRLTTGTLPFDEEVRAPAPEALPLMPPTPEGPPVTVSSQVVYGIRTLRHWLQWDPSQGPRPAVLIDAPAIAAARKRAQPGDLLLARRERHLTAMGDGGYWQSAGVFAGGDDDRVLTAFAQGVSFVSFERFATADHFAILRARLSWEETAAMLARGASAVGAESDPWEDSASADRLGTAELIARLFGDEAVPEAISLDRRVYSVNGAVERFDSVYGSPQERFDLILFLDGNEARRSARPEPVEEFRRTWRRPKWTIAQEKTDEK